MSDKQTEGGRQQTTAEMNESAVGAMLEALSLSRTRRFCLMVEDECANLVRRNMLSHGAVCRLEFPPLSESLRDLISCTGLSILDRWLICGHISACSLAFFKTDVKCLALSAAGRFGLRCRTLPEGDQEKSVELICSAASCVPTLSYRDMIASVCPLKARSQDQCPSSNHDQACAVEDSGVGGDVARSAAFAADLSGQEVGDIVIGGIVGDSQKTEAGYVPADVPAAMLTGAEEGRVTEKESETVGGQSVGSVDILEILEILKNPDQHEPPYSTRIPHLISQKNPSRQNAPGLLCLYTDPVELRKRERISLAPRLHSQSRTLHPQVSHTPPYPHTAIPPQTTVLTSSSLHLQLAGTKKSNFRY